MEIAGSEFTPRHSLGGGLPVGAAALFVLRQGRIAGMGLPGSTGARR